MDVVIVAFKDMMIRLNFGGKIEIHMISKLEELHRGF